MRTQVNTVEALAENSIKLAAAVGELLSRVETKNVKEASFTKKASEVKPRIVEMMLNANLIDSSQKKLAADVLSDPSRTLDVLYRAIEKLAQAEQTEKQAEELGESEQTNKPKVVRGNPYVDRRHEGKTAADEIFERTLRGHN